MRSGIRLRLASTPGGSSHVGQHLATSSVRLELIWEQEVAGSNPAIPTANFRMCCQSCLSNPGRKFRCLALPDVGDDRSATAHVGYHFGSSQWPRL
jgi:hypothetical protein